VSTSVPDLVPLWAIILALGIFFYVLLDGFDLGVGILYGFARDAASRRLIMNSIAPIWDGNETWLVLGGVGLLAAFPLTFSILIPALYFPLLLILLALVFRGVAFEFCERDGTQKTFWDHAFACGSALASFGQGIVVGAFIQGFRVEGRHFAGTSLDCFTPFSIFTGCALVCGYALLGAAWLVLKTEGELQQWARRWARIGLIVILLSICIVSVWTSLQDPEVAARWFSWPNWVLLAPVPLCTVLLAYWGWRALTTRSSDLTPFIAAMGLFVLSYTGVAVSLWPMVIRHRYTLWEAASSPSTQIFLLVGMVFLLPVILIYSSWSYWVFRGKVRADIGY
jgi:cytochrome d ubiquinol oxidase subunit II